MAPLSPRQHEKLLQALLDIGQELSSTIDLEELLNRILKVSQDLFQFENAIIRLLDAERQVLVTAASYGYSEEAAGQEIRMGQGVMGRVAASGEPILVADLGTLPDYVPGIRDARSELAVPLVARENVVGVFNVESPLPDAFGEEDIAPLMILAGQAAIAIENARLYDDLRTMSERNRQLHQFNSRILKSVNLGIYTVDDQLRVTSWNPRMEEMSGMLEKDVVGSDLSDLFPMLEQEGFAERIRRVLETGQAEKFRFDHRDLKGDLHFQKRRLAPLREEDRTAGVVVIVEDVTEFRRLLDQTIQSEKLVEVGRLSAGIAHEINNPLAVIAYGSELLQREENLSSFQRELVDRISDEAGRLQSLTGSLLSFSRPQEIAKRWVDLGEVLRDVLRLIRYEVSRKQVRLEESYGDLPLVLADPNKLKQVFINLILNATQAMKRGGELRVKTDVTLGGEVEVAIADSGPGIPESLRERVFQPFFSTKKEGEGTGLGLYICRRIIVAEHDGQLVFETEEGKGTTFRVVLPPGEVVEEESVLLESE